MTVPEGLTGAKNVDKDKYNYIPAEVCQEMTLPLDFQKLGDVTGGADSGFSSRNSMVSTRMDEESCDRVVDVVAVPNDESNGCGCRSVVTGILKFLSILGLLYLFICSLDLLGNAFQLLGGKAAGQVFANSDLLSNPITGLMMGILATVLLQSSSTSTSIIITMVSSGIIQVQPAIPIIMGCNIGTTVTNTLVSLAHSRKGKEFERAFSGATVHDVFNWLTVIVLLPFEASTHVLYKLTGAIIESGDLSSFKGRKQDLLKTLTKPLTKLVVQVDKKVITEIAEKIPGAKSKRVLKTFCTQHIVNVTGEDNSMQLMNTTTESCDETFHAVLNHYHATLSDTTAGTILLVFSIFLLTVCLMSIVKLLNSILKNKITIWLKKIINAKLPFPIAWFTGYLTILIGAALTIIVQSSSVFTSALTPLVGVGCLKLRRMYPLTLGSNIGTTATGILAALAAPANKLDVALQLALCHLFFNICGITLFYPVHPMRKIPINVAKYLGKTTAKYRWFAVFYLVLLFFLVPGLVFALSMAGKIPFIVTISVLGAVVLFIIVLNVLQNKCKTRLPTCLQTWEFLPECLRSLEPLDKLIKKIISIFRRCKCCDTKPEADNQSVAVVVNEENNDEDDDDDDDVIEEDECTTLYRVHLTNLCCPRKKSPKSSDKTKDEGFCDGPESTLISQPIYTPPSSKKHSRFSLNNKQNMSPSITPLLQVVTDV